MTTEVVPLSLALTVLEVALWCVWAAHTVPKLLEHPELPPSLPLPPPLHQSSPSPPLSSVSPSAHPQPTICAVGLPRVCQSPSTSWLEYPLSPPPTYESRTPPRPFDPAAPPWLLAPSSPPWPVSPPAPPGSLVPPAPPWSVVDSEGTLLALVAFNQLVLRIEKEHSCQWCFTDSTMHLDRAG